MNENSVRTKPVQCPCCLYDMDGATCISSKEKVSPLPGDFTLCINCGALLTFDKDVDLEQPTEEQIETIWPEDMEKIRMAQTWIKQMRGTGRCP